MRLTRLKRKLIIFPSVMGFLILLAILGLFYLERIRAPEGRYLPGAPSVTTDSIPVSLKVDPEACTRSSISESTEKIQPVYPDSSIGGGSVRGGNFIFELWVYCDPKFGENPPDPEYYSDISGLGISIAWHYDGPSIKGTTEDYWGFEPEIQKRGEYQGDLTSGTSTEAITGVKIPAGLRDKTLTGEIPLVFSLRIHTPSGETFGSSLSFTFESHPDGLEPINFQIASFEEAPQTGRALPTKVIPPSTYIPPAPAGAPPPEDFDPSNSPLDIMIHMGDDLENPSFFYGDIYAGDYLLGRVDLGYSPVRWCDRSQDGSRIAIVYYTLTEMSESHQLRWFDLRDVAEVFAPLPDMEIMSGVSWSPVGYRLAFFACAANQKCGLYLLNTDTNALSLVTDRVIGYLQLFWKPDGKELGFFATGPEGEKFFIVDVNSGEILFSADREINLEAPGSPIYNWGVKLTEGKDCFQEYLGVLYP